MRLYASLACKGSPSDVQYTHVFHMALNAFKFLHFHNLFVCVFFFFFLAKQASCKVLGEADAFGVLF